jgi:MFS family permease
LIEIPFLGRIRSTSAFYLLGLISMFLGVIFPNYFEVFAGIFNFSISAAFNTSTAYSSEIYPTKLRDIALGFLYFSTRVGGILSQFIFLALYHWDMWLPFYVLLILLAMNILFMSLLPYDTYGQRLDVGHKHHTIKHINTEEDIEIIEKKN